MWVSSVPYDTFDFTELERKWPSPFVDRSQVGALTGGILQPKFMQALESKGQGLPRVRIGKKVAYRVKDIADYLKSKSQDYLTY